MKEELGFTLLELMIVVATIAILSAIAVPAYTDYVMRGRIPDATSNLATKRVQMEQYFQDNRSYAGAPACADDNTSSRFFAFTCVANGAAYTLTATGTGAMAGFNYTINQANAKTSNITRSGWSNPATNNCWAIKKDGSC